MKRIVSLLLAAILCFSMLALTACGGDQTEDDGVMSYEEFMAAPVDSVCTVETNIQAWQGWWNNKLTAYFQDNEGGAYFAYEMACTEEQAALLTKGARVKLTGTKAEYAGEIEFYGTVSFEFVEDGESYVATATDVTALIDNADELIKHQNKLVSFKGLTVVSVSFKDGAATPAESQDDVYVTVKLASGEEHSFCVETYLTGPSTEVYQTCANLAAGDVVDIEGFLYWYNGVNTHVTACVVK